MKKLLCIVITLSIVMTILASVTAFAATPLPWDDWKPNRNLTNGPKQLAFATNYPEGTKYTHESAVFSISADVTKLTTNIFGYRTINDYKPKTAETVYIDIVYSVDDDTAYLFVDKMFKASVINDASVKAGSCTECTSADSCRTCTHKYGAHTFAWTGCTPTLVSYEQKAYGSDFSFRDAGLYGGTASYDTETSTYAIKYEIARMRKAGYSGTVGTDMIGALNSAGERCSGMYIAGYNSNGMLLFVTKGDYYHGNTSHGIVNTTTSPATEKAAKIKLFVYDEMNYPVGSLVPAIEALEFDIPVK